MKKITLLFSLILVSAMSFAQTPIITMISDGDCSGGNPKVVELYADGTVDFSLYSLEIQTNSNTTWGSTLNLAALGTITDDFVYIYKDDPSFATEYPSATNLLPTTSSAVNFNGDDRIRIIEASNSTVIDQYGVDSQDGSGEAWEYMDGYAKRNNGTTATGGFSAGDWSYFKSALLGQCNTTTFESIIGIGTFVPGTVSCPLVVTVNDVSCDAETVNQDTYTVSGTFSGGGTETYNFSINAGTIISTDDPSTMATGSIVVTAIPEGTDFNYTIVSSSCNINGTVTSPVCEPATPVTDIASLRAGTIGEKYELTGEAIITYQQAYRNQKYIQDATGAILIDDNNGMITTTYNQYDGVTGIVGTLGEFNDVMQFVPVQDAPAATSTGNSVAIQFITISDFESNSEIYESELIAFTSVSITEGDGTVTFSTGSDYTLTDGANTTTLRTNFFNADYIGTVIQDTPYNNIIGIAGEYQGTPQFTPRSLSDFNATVATSNVNELAFVMYPNPTQDILTIEMNESQNAQVTIFDILGKQVLSQSLENNTINVSNLTQGMYIVKVKNNNTTATKKLIVR